MEKKKLAIEEAKAQAKGLLPEGAPNLDNPSGFSPAPKNGKLWMSCWNTFSSRMCIYTSGINT